MLADLFLQRGHRRFVRSDNGPEFIARKLIDWMMSVEFKPPFIEPGEPVGERLYGIVQRKDAL